MAASGPALADVLAALCGMAAVEKRQVISADFESDPLWLDTRGLVRSILSVRQDGVRVASDICDLSPR
jgi:hypothetical protein